MKNPFNKRVTMQRRVLAIVNRKSKEWGELAGLSRAAITLWANNGLEKAPADIIQCISRISELSASALDISDPPDASVIARSNLEIEDNVALLEKMVEGCHLSPIVASSRP